MKPKSVLRNVVLAWLFSCGVVMVDNATVVQTDIQCSNGVIHVIDAVVMPN